MLPEQLKPKILTPHEKLIASYGNLQQRLQELWEENFVLGKKGFPKKIREEIEILFNPFIKPLSQNSIEELSQLLINLLAQNSPEYAEHCKRVGKLAYELAFSAGEQNPQILSDIYYAGLLHDIGKMMVPKHILESTNGLSIKEKEILRTHNFISYLILRIFPQTRRIAELVLFHHERNDGNGIFNLDKSQINPNLWYVIAADYFDALKSEKPYKKTLSSEQSLEEMIKNYGAIPLSVLKLTQKLFV